MNQRYGLALLVGLLLSMVGSNHAFAGPIKPEHQVCEKDADCSWIAVGCQCLCRLGHENYDVINRKYLDEYKKLEHCNESELHQCATMGVCYVSEHPVASCKNNQCAIDWKKDIPR